MKDNITFKALIFLSALLILSPTVFAEELYGIFMIVKGSVEVESTKRGRETAKVGTKVYPGDKITSFKDSRAKVVMADRNVFNLSPDSQMSIGKYENDAKTGVKNVELDLTRGKIRSNVEQKYDGEKSQFLIKTPTAVAGVRGTQFLTSFNATTQITEVVTFKGAVQVAPIMANGQVSNQVVIIKKGEMSSVKAGQEIPEPPRALPKEEINKTDKESQAKSRVVEDNSVASLAPGDKTSTEKSTDTATGDKDSKGDKRGITNRADRKEAKNREPAAEDNNDKPKDDKAYAGRKHKDAIADDMMTDKRDMDLDQAKEVKAPMTADGHLSLPTEFRPPTMGLRPIQNPVIDEIIRSKLNNTRVIIRPILPKQ
ncbi:MAG: hypothetical protein B7Y39_18885 [Bdellovibrio sp. 28-41-41]|nr:MAG: hypothetical protein B7Y39_18885 [Bdellovibrio sp. 28-41-41]